MRERSMGGPVFAQRQGFGEWEVATRTPTEKPWESQPGSPRLGLRTRTVFMMRTSGAASRPRGTPPPLETVIESPSTSGELPPASVPERGELVTGVVTMARPQQITLALESQRDLVEPTGTLRMATLKHGDPIEKGMRLSGLEIMFVQQEKGILPRAAE